MCDGARVGETACDPGGETSDHGEDGGVSRQHDMSMEYMMRYDMTASHIDIA